MLKEGWSPLSMVLAQSLSSTINLLYKVNSPLKEHVPDIVASGFIVHENGVYRTVPWNGKGLPEVIAICFLRRICCSPPWIHSDIMDDNTHMEPVLPMNGFDEGALKGGSIGNGDPLYDLIPLYLDVFRGDVSLLKKFLESYNLPLSRRAPDHTPPYCGCDCILHKENVLEAILCLWKELRTATFWQCVCVKMIDVAVAIN
ncbi:F-box protein, partial [Ananas comosus]